MELRTASTRGPRPLQGLTEELLQMPPQLQASDPEPFPLGHPGFVLLNPPPFPFLLDARSCSLPCVYTGRPGFPINRSGKLSSELFCQLILWGMTLSTGQG